LRAAWLLYLLSLSPFFAPAAPAFAQDEFLVNDDRVDRNQWAPRAARGSTGALVVAWMDGRNLNGSVVDFDTYLMTLRDPQAVGSTVNRRLNDDPPGAPQGFPSIDASPSGTFFCVWEDSRAGNRDIYGATLDSIGLRITPNLRLNDDVGFSEQANPQVISVGSSRYLVVWGDQRQGQSEVFASELTSSGAPIGPNLKISVDPVSGGSYQGEPGAAARADGRTLVAWLDGREGGTVFGATFDVYAQWLNVDGQPIGGNFKVNDTVGPQRNTSVAVAADSADGYVVAWIDRRNLPGDQGDVYAQRYNGAGNPIGSNVRVNDDGPGREQRAVRALAIPGGAFLLWEDLRGNLGLDSNVEAARVPLSSSPGANFRVNVSIPARQGTPGGTWDGRDAILAVWEDGRNGSPDVYAISVLPDGTRRGTETQLNDDAASGDQRRPEVGRGPGRYLATWTDRRTGTNDLFGEWITAAGGRDGPNHRIWKDDGVTRALSASSTVAPGGSALVAAHVTRDSDAGEIRGFYYTTIGAAPSSSFWISDSLPSAQAMPALTATGSGYAAAWLDARDGIPRIYGQQLAANAARVGVNHAILAVDPVDPVFALDLDADPLGGYWLCYSEGAASIDQRLWIVHLDENLLADRSPMQVAPSMIGERAHPSIGAGSGGRVEVAWLGAGLGGLGQCYHQGFDHLGVPLGPVFALGPADGLETQAAPRLSVAGGISVATWEAKRDGNWSVWLQAFASGAAPTTGVLRIDQDVLGADQLDSSPGLDAAGRAVVLWSDGRSASSGTDILGRVFSFATTGITEPPLPPPAPETPPLAPPRALRIGPARPNPFSGTIGISLEVPSARSARVTVRVVNVRGEAVATLYDGPTTAERLLVRWDGTDGRSHEAASGVYWIVAEAGGERRALRVVQLR